MTEFSNQFDSLLAARGWGGLFGADGHGDALPSFGALGHDARESFAASGLFQHALPHGGLFAATPAFQLPLPPAADTPGGKTTGVTIASGQVITDTLEAKGDHDWFKITLNEGQHVTLLLNGLGAGGLEDPLMRLRDSAGNVLLSNDDIDPGVVRTSRIEFTATTAGTYYIDAGAYANDYTGAYQLQVFDSTATVDSIGATRATSAEMNFGANFNGVLETASDHDWIAVTLVAGQDYVVRINGDGTSALNNPSLAVRGPAGNIIGQNDNTYGLNPEVSFTAATSGTFYIDVSGSGAGATGEYTVSVTKALEVFTYDQIANQLTSTYWGGQQHSFIIGADNILTYDLGGLTAAGKTLAKAALQVWSDVIGVTFSEVTGGAELTFQNTDEGAFADSTYDANGRIETSIVNISKQWITDYGTSLDSYTMQTFIHEIGHALGLGHAGNYNGTATYPLDASYSNDAWATTVMSYFSQGENDYFAKQGFSTAYLSTPMNGDIVAMQDLYGLSTTTRLGSTVYGFGTNAGNAIFNAATFSNTAYCVIDSGGIDTLNYSGFAFDQLIDLRAENFMNIGGLIGNIVIARGTVIENAKGGSGDDEMIGNDVRNVLLGNDGKDDLSGGAGNDLLKGGNGFDILRGEAGSDTLRGGDGEDTLSGADGTDSLYGEGGNDRLIGGNANDTLDGGFGDDVLIGGRGKDTVTGGEGADRIQIDSAASTANLTTITDFEHLIDSIALDRTVFTGLAATGALDETAFRTGAAAVDADDRIIYNTATGEIFYDADGALGAAQVLIAKVDAGTTVTADDFSVFASAAANADKLASASFAMAATHEDAFGLI